MPSISFHVEITAWFNIRKKTHTHTKKICYKDIQRICHCKEKTKRIMHQKYKGSHTDGISFSFRKYNVKG